ncbi:hypothetical protein HYX15_03625 [Candidatus Woesearchaeota archaeon]|nr:hypothetical protein [Candidatus Woesearchaeota archaeon]
MKLTLDNKGLFELTVAEHKETYTFGKGFVAGVKEIIRGGHPIDIETRVNEYSEQIASEIEKSANSLKIGRVKTIKNAIFDDIARLDKEFDIILYGFAQPEEHGEYTPTLGVCYQGENKNVGVLKDYIIKELAKK